MIERLLVSVIAIVLLVLISTDIEIGAWVFTGHWLLPIPFAYVLAQVGIILFVLYAFTREQPEDPIKERGIK